jgi:hypothetical protein
MGHMIRKLAKEQRKKKRGQISVPVKYTDLSEVSDVKKKVTGKGTSADLSDNGLGLFSDKELKPGTVLEIECEDIWETSKQFTVKWCNKIEYNFYRLGLVVRK